MKSYKETIRRALRTFLQAALGYIVTNVTLVTMGYEAAEVRSALVGLFTAAIAAGLAAVMNLPAKNDEEAEG